MAAQHPPVPVGVLAPAMHTCQKGELLSQPAGFPALPCDKQKKKAFKEEKGRYDLKKKKNQINKCVNDHKGKRPIKKNMTSIHSWGGVHPGEEWAVSH